MSSKERIKTWDEQSILRLEKSADVQLKVSTTIMITVLSIFFLLPMTLIIKSIFDGGSTASIVELLASVGIVKSLIFFGLEVIVLRLANHFHKDALEKLDYIEDRKQKKNNKFKPLKHRIGAKLYHCKCA